MLSAGSRGLLLALLVLGCAGEPDVEDGHSASPLTLR